MPAFMVGERLPPGAVLAHIRAATRPAHDALEGSLGLLGDIGIDEYRRVLARFYGFWTGWQPQVAALLGDAALSTPRQRLHMLEADLLSLGATLGELAILPRCPLVELQDDAQALGSLYVMEGSSLGGRAILRNIERRLGSSPCLGRAYFNGYGEETVMMWRSFLARLDQVPPARVQSVAAGAAATFEQIAWWLATSAPAGLQPLRAS